MHLDHEAIYSAYSGIVVSIDDSEGAFDKDGKSVALDNAKVTAARKVLDDAWAATEYQRQRKLEYPSWEDQMDKIYHQGIDAWKADIKAIKDKYPKP
jgi:hypothetical protein|tara:strand:+ start:1049 stop:1339 length:291 start_codon:yes stop_codon:yes gene_type:complete